ncbi:MAG: hypothetical protein JWN40_1 [Phycisphaerales bacterium]|jgi:hypothetical protein|nr:hypothetical protein [Phycisphaerales bacterium]
MRSTVVTWIFVVAAAMGASVRADPGQDGAGSRHKPIVAGSLTVNPYDVIAVYRPQDQQGVAVYVGRPGQAIQAIIFKDSREAATVFKEIWDNAEVTKDPGEDDARPLTRMRPKGADRAGATLIVNVQRVLAISWDVDHRQVHVHLDKLLANELLTDPNGDGESLPYLEIPNVHDAAEAVMAAYKACLLKK